MRGPLVVLGLTLVLAACDGEDPVNAALRDAAAARHAAAVKETGVAEPSGAAPAPPAASTDQAWVEATIKDHRETISAAEALLARTDDPGVRRTAENLIAARKREIAELEALRPEPTAAQ